ncbi:alternate-type signal peptide domain-containing protein [Georgenia sp. Z1344]|uniref:alternate-type signal peptide domain-containing protein n=1 Tax=Georgenia sp. Z1344 TaxID=3416706 RepID=UPI003CEA127D
MRKKTVGVLAGAAAAAVALGSGGTFALWSDDTSVDAGTIQAGNLEVEAQGDFQWYDATLNRVPFIVWDIPFPRHDWGHTIANMNGDYRVVPGDVVVGAQDVLVDLHGDNLRAHLTVGPADGATAEFEGLSVEYGVYNNSTNSWIATGLELGDDREFGFQADGVGQEDGSDDPFWTVLPRESELTVVILGVFDEDTGDRVSVNDITELGSLEITLEQSMYPHPAI